MTEVIVLGSLNMDLVVTADHLPIPGETLNGLSFGTFPGGKGANQAVSAARLGSSVSMVGRVGDDDFGNSIGISKEMLSPFFPEGVSHSYRCN